MNKTIINFQIDEEVKKSPYLDVYFNLLSQKTTVNNCIKSL
jgi:hypothetical protein